MTTSDQPQCVVALAFGYRRAHGRVLPGDSNEDLAAIVASQYAHLPKILQFEVADAYANLDNEPVLRIEDHRSGAYLDSREVLVQAAELCRKSGWTTIALVAHPGHLTRAARCAENLGLQTNEAQLIEMRRQVVRFDLRSEQGWTRSESRLVLHERLATVLYKGLKYI